MTMSASTVPNWGDRRHTITIRHLLTHTSGLREAFLLQGFAPELPQHINQQIVNILTRARGFEFVPGSRFEYNNGGYTLLAAIVERVSGQTLAVFAEANIFKPLGMMHTHFHDDATRIVPNRATGYSRAANGFRVAVRTYTDRVLGNAGVFTTVGDLLRWEQNFADVRVGDPALITEMQTPAIASVGHGWIRVRARDRAAPWPSDDWAWRRRRRPPHIRRALSRCRPGHCRALQPRRHRPGAAGEIDRRHTPV